MKVLVLSHMYPNSMNPVYGIFVHEQVKALKNLGHDVNVISPVPWAPFPINIINKKWNQYSNINKYEQIEGIDVYHPRKITLPRKILYDKSGKFYYKAIKNITNKIHQNFKFDIIHSHVSLPDGIAGSYLSDLFKVPSITTIHGQDLQQTININKKCYDKIGLSFKKNDAIIFVSEKLKDIAIEEFPRFSDKYHIISNGLNLDKIFPINSRLKKQYKNKTVLLSVSNLKKTKGIDLNLKAVNKVTEKKENIYYIIVGDGTQKENLKSLAKELGIEENVEFTGRLPHDKVMEYMSICDVFSLPSWQEGFGIVYIEAMAHEKPVIACKGEGIDGIIKNGENGILVSPKSVNDLSKAIFHLLNNDNLRKEISKKAQKTAKEYTWENNAINTMKLYKKLLK